jgi:hypothetical protein
MRFVIALLALSLTACGFTDSIKNSEDTDYVIASQSKAGGMYGLFRGSGTICKLSKHNVPTLDYTIEFNKGECAISVAK